LSWKGKGRGKPDEAQTFPKTRAGKGQQYVKGIALVTKTAMKRKKTHRKGVSFQ